MSELAKRREPPAPSWCPGKSSCLALEGPGPVCEAHALLLAGVSGFGVTVAGRVPAHVYRVFRIASPKRVELVRARDGATYTAPLALLRLAPLEAER
jgi:hypothetical protein